MTELLGKEGKGFGGILFLLDFGYQIGEEQFGRKGFEGINQIYRVVLMWNDLEGEMLFFFLSFPSFPLPFLFFPSIIVI